MLSFLLSTAIPAAAITSLLWTVVTAVERTEPASSDRR
jgi:hypothetical protein